MSSSGAGRERCNDHPLAMSPEEFRRAGYQTVDLICDLLAGLSERPVTPGESPGELRKQIEAVLGSTRLPEQGGDAAQIINDAAQLLFDHSTYNGHPRFWGYITSSAAPIGALADMMAAAVNANVGAWNLSPMASEIERLTVRWIATLIRVPQQFGGLLVSGGNAANFVGFLAARRAKLGEEVRSVGLQGRRLRVYTSRETHTWIEKACDLFGLGSDAICWVECDDNYQMSLSKLQAVIEADRHSGYEPFLVVATAGSVSSGAVDPLAGIADLCEQFDLWFHVDGAYGAFAAVLPELAPTFAPLGRADSIALDPHKWLYVPIEAGCTLLREPQQLSDTFSYQPSYYHFEEGGDDVINFHEYGMQNSRGFRALKVWAALRQAGREGYIRSIRDDIALSQYLYDLAERHPEFEVFTQKLSITTFRYRPEGLAGDSESRDDYLNRLNTTLVERLQAEGAFYVSNAVLNGCFLLRACFVNFRSTQLDVEALLEGVTALGRRLHTELAVNSGDVN